MSQMPESISPPPMDPEEEKMLDALISNVLRWGLILSTGLMLLGEVIHVVHATEVPSEFTHFTLQSAQLRTLPGIIHLALKGDGEGIMQLAVVVLLATPFLRVLAGGLMFFRQRDWKYVIVSLIVLSVLLYSLFAGHATG